jgi:hypothetical protein
VVVLLVHVLPVHVLPAPVLHLLVLPASVHLSTACAVCCAGSIDKLAKVLKPGGHLSHIMNHGTDQAAMQKLQASGAATASTTLVKPDGVQLQEIFELIAAGKVRLEVAKVGPGGLWLWSLVVAVFLGPWALGKLPVRLARHAVLDCQVVNSNRLWRERGSCTACFQQLRKVSCSPNAVVCSGAQCDAVYCGDK